MTKRTGLFLSLEGPEGAGKTTLIRHLEAALRADGFTVVRTREPGGDPVGERVRELLLHAGGDGSDGTKTEPLSAEAELLLFAAARAQNVRTVIRPALEAGHVVLCDRFTDSTLAYQGYGRGLSLETIRTVNTFATGGLFPERTFLLDLPPALGLARRPEAERNRLDREDLAFHERVRAGFLAVAREEPERITLLDASRGEAVVTADLLAHVRALLATRL